LALIKPTGFRMFNHEFSPLSASPIGYPPISASSSPFLSLNF